MPALAQKNSYKVQVNRLKKKSTKCFFTSLECEWPSKKERKRRGGFTHFEATTEHLVPLSIYKGKIEGNYVVACRLANNMLGNAPISVKWEVRDTLQSVTIPSYMSEEKKVETVKAIISSVLSKYMIASNHRDYVWNWRTVPRKKGTMRKEARQRYINLLTTEEYELDRKFNEGRMTKESH